MQGSKDSQVTGAVRSMASQANLRVWSVQEDKGEHVRQRGEEPYGE